MEILLEKMKKTINKELQLNEFCEWFEDWYNNLETNELDNKIRDLLDDLFNDIGFFEPNIKIREEHHAYFGENELLMKIKNILKILNCSSSCSAIPKSVQH